MSGTNEIYDPYRNLPKPPHPSSTQPEFPNLHPNTPISPVNYHRFDDVPRPIDWYSVLVHYFNAEYFAYLNDLGIPERNHNALPNPLHRP